LGVLRAVPVSRFTRLRESLADTSNECSNFTQYRQQRRDQLQMPRPCGSFDPRSHAPAKPLCRESRNPEFLHRLNEIGSLIHHGKSFESCLLLLDLSRFLKL
jgi:hypothetical protein